MKDEIVLITGANGSIANAIVEKYLSNNVKVIACDLADTPKDAKFINNYNYVYYKADVTNKKELQDLFEKISQNYKKLDHIVSTVGCPSKTEEKGILEMEMEDIDKSIMLNLNNHIYVTKIFLPLLIKSESKNKSITYISSVNGVRNFKIPLPAYSAAKAGIFGFMGCIVKDFGAYGIRVNTVTPGTVPSKENLENIENYVNIIYKNGLALQDFTRPEDIADAVYSVSHIMKAVTGQNLIVDSGQTV